MLERIRALVDRWRELKEIDALTDRDLDDLGMTRAQVRLECVLSERAARGVLAG